MRATYGFPNPTRRELLWIAEGKKCHFCGKPTRLCSEQASDQAHLEITALKRDLRISEGKEKSLIGELTLFHKIVEDQEKELNSMKSITVWSLIRRRIAEWINPKN
jgi:hypothetical protein